MEIKIWGIKINGREQGSGLVISLKKLTFQKNSIMKRQKDKERQNFEN
jgi:hypothetical protein